MRRSASSAGGLALLVWTITAVAQPLPPRQAIAITDVMIIDLELGRPTGPGTVLIDAGRIVAIVAPRDARIPASARRVDGRGKYLIPGLVDMHVHLFNHYSKRPPNDWAFAMFIANGVTAVREMNANPASIAQVLRWRSALDAGELAAPRIVAAGVSVRGDSPDDAARAVAAASVAGADFIKVFSDVPLAHWPAILDAARRFSLPVVGHVPAGLSALAAATAGLRDNEHLMQLFEACSTVETLLMDERRELVDAALLARRDAQEAQALAAFDPASCRRTSEALAGTGQVQVPTLVLPFAESTLGSRALQSDARWRYLRADERARWERIRAGVAAQDDALAQQRWAVARKIVTALHRAGVPILAGTDAPMPGLYPGFSLHEELALLVESGLTPGAALRSATLAPAEFLGIAADTGSVTPGKRADLVVLDADPTRDIRNTRAISAVLIDGRLLQRAELDALLESAANAQAPR